MTHTRRFAFATFFLLLASILPPYASAQVATGTPPFGSFGGGPDIINLGNLNAHWAIPVLNKPGRGTNFFYYLTYDSSIWVPVTSGSTKSWVPNSNYGWASMSALSSGNTGYLTYYYSQTYCYDQNGHPTGTEVWYDSTVYYDPWGIAHSFPGYVHVLSGGCGSLNVSTYPSTATDGSGLVVNSYQGPVLKPDGSTISPPINPVGGSYATTFTDRNGNQINSDSSGHFYDTLSSSAAVLTVSGSGTASSPVKFTYTAPSGASPYYQMNYTNFTIATNFGVSGISEYKSSGAVPLVTSITLPDGSQCTFQYESTPGSCTPYSGTTCTTARLTKVTLPTGGQITYAYSGGNNGILPDGSTATLTRTTPDTGSNSWKYAHSESGTAWTTLITDPQGNQTNMNFQGIYETQRQVYAGSQSGGNLLRQWITCYNGNTSNCNSTAITLPITQRNVNDQYGSSGLQCKHNYLYNSVGGLTEQDDYDYGSGAPGALLRQILVTYASLGNITAFRQQVTVKNGSGTILSQTNYNYDETTPTATSGIAQHTSVSGSRGNMTSINYPVSGLTAHFTYWDTGSPNTSQDVNAATTTYNYSSNTADCQMAFPTSISITQPTSMSRSFSWSCTGGVMTSLTDENNNVTTLQYTDPNFWRPAEEDFPDGGKTIWTYNSQTSLTTQVLMNSNPTYITSTVLLDGLGRTSQTQLSDPEGPSIDYTAMTYDALGRPYQAFNPTRCSPPTVNCGEATWGYTTTLYDALGRITSATLQDGSVGSASYTNNTVTATDPAGKKRLSTFDALGRLTQVNEDPSGLNYVTTYGYDALGNLLNVTENGGRQRTYVYDAMSRLTSETNPESGTITYGYDASGHVGDLTSRVAPAPNQTGSTTVTTTYSWDALHRLTGKTYSDGTTPGVTLQYDQTSIYGVNPQNPIGRLTNAINNSGAAITTISYDKVGRVAAEWQCTPYNCGSGSFPLNFTYDLAGDMTSYSNGVGITFTQSFDVAGRPTGLTSSLNDSQHPATLATVDSSVGYYPPGALRKMAFGNGLTQSNVFNNRLQPCLMDVNNNATTLQTCNDSTPSGNILDLWMGYNAGTSDNGNVMNWNATGNQSFVRTFTYDSIDRLSTLNQSSGNASTCSSTFSLAWGYDAWGNRTDQTVTGGTCNAFHGSVNANNQLSGSPYQYDAAGNMTNDGNHTYFYDGENRLIQVDGTLGTCSSATACYTYDAFGRRAEKMTGSTKLDYIYDLAENVLSEWCTNCGGYTGPTAEYILMSGNFVAEYKNSTTYFPHPDHLGSTRLLTGLNQGVVQNLDYLPFGELNSSNSGYSTHMFTGDERDSETNLDHTWFRQYSSQLGRWMHPDPAGLAAVDPSNPQSWNRYSYVLNNPMDYVDHDGLCPGPLPPGPNGLCRAPVVPPGGALGPGNGICFLDGLPVPCDVALGALGAGAGAVCPNNNCSGLQLVSGPGGTNVWQQWLPWYVAGFNLIGENGAILEQSATIYWHWVTVGTASDDNWGLWDTIKSIFGQIPWSVTITPTPGVITGAWIPASNTLCLGSGLGAGISAPNVPIGFGGGPLVFGDLKNAKQVLEGPSIFYGFQPTPGIGWQHTFNTSGQLLGPTGGTWGGQIGFTVSGCKDF
jgi:RHS repeat-associated protein